MVNAFSVLKFRLFYNLRHNIYIVEVLEEISLLTFKIIRYCYMRIANMASFQFFWWRFFLKVVKVRWYNAVLFYFKEVWVNAMVVRIQMNRMLEGWVLRVLHLLNYKRSVTRLIDNNQTYNFKWRHLIIIVFVVLTWRSIAAETFVLFVMISSYHHCRLLLFRLLFRVYN